MNKTAKQWLIFGAVNIGLVGLILLIKCYLAFVSIPIVKMFGQCLFAKALHLYCPGCGGTRAVASLLRFDFLTSLRYNPLVLMFVSLFVYYDIKAVINIIKGKDKVLGLNAKLLFVILAVVLAFFILRNALLLIWHIDPVGDYVDYWR